VRFFEVLEGRALSRPHGAAIFSAKSNLDTRTLWPPSSCWRRYRVLYWGSNGLGADARVAGYRAGYEPDGCELEV